MPDEAPVTSAKPFVSWLISLSPRPLQGPMATRYNSAWQCPKCHICSLLGHPLSGLSASMRRIGFVVSPGFQLMSFAALSAFEFANLSAPRPFYDVQVMSEAGGPVKSSLGLGLETAAFDDAVYDTVIFGGDLGGSDASPGVVDFVRRSAASARRVASICTGTFVRDQAGLLDGRQATTHWGRARDLAARYPKIKVDPDRIFIVDGPIWTSAGASAGVDLALGMIENDLGPEITRLTARTLVVYHRRAGGQSQHSALLELDAKSDRIQSALDYAKRNLASRLSVEDLAE